MHQPGGVDERHRCVPDWRQGLDLYPRPDGEALSETLTGLARAFGAPGAPAEEDEDPFARHGLGGSWNDPAASTTAACSITGRELLRGSAFHLAGGGDSSGPGLAAWGRVAHGSFDGEEASDGGRTRIDGEVMTGTLGALPLRRPA